MADSVAFRLLNDKVAILPNELEKVTKGGIVLPEKNQMQTANEPITGVIVALGPGKLVDGKLVVPDLKVGARVIFGKYHGSGIEHEGKKYRIIDSHEILAVY